jgi:hypothetical protein
MKKYYQCEMYADCPNCSINALFLEYLHGPDYITGKDSPCYTRLYVSEKSSCFKAHPIPLGELINGPC